MEDFQYVQQDPVIGGSLLLTYTTGYVAPLLLAASFAGALQVYLVLYRIRCVTSISAGVWTNKSLHYLLALIIPDAHARILTQILGVKTYMVESKV